MKLTDALPLVIADTRQANPEVGSDQEAVDLARECSTADLVVIDDKPTKEAYQVVLAASSADIAKAMR
ncbi:hypothetical protein [Lentzea sp. CA-135723]|uniref:hypothetical protein n=1 Tax=Lentzea sp. CA-135723 TaxID=3239950 RepID=UPI003D8BED03